MGRVVTWLVSSTAIPRSLASDDKEAASEERARAREAVWEAAEEREEEEEAAAAVVAVVVAVPKHDSGEQLPLLLHPAALHTNATESTATRASLGCLSQSAGSAAAAALT